MSSAIILAGGESKRFQKPGEPWRDKILEKIKGRTILEMVVEACMEATDEVIVSVNKPERKEKYREILGKAGFGDVKICVDEKTSVGRGPIIGIQTALLNSTHRNCIVIPGDRPYMKPSFLKLMLELGVGYDAATLLWPDGRIEPLTTFYDRNYALNAIKTLLRLGRFRLDNPVRGGRKVKFISVMEFRDLDPQLESLVDIDYPRDLVVKPRLTFRGDLKSSIELKREFDLKPLATIVGGVAWESRLIGDVPKLKSDFWEATFLSYVADQKGDKRTYLEAGEKYLAEKSIYEGRKLRFLTLHALIDAYQSFMKAGVEKPWIKREIDRLKAELRIRPQRQLTLSKGFSHP